MSKERNGQTLQISLGKNARNFCTMAFEKLLPQPAVRNFQFISISGAENAAQLIRHMRAKNTSTTERQKDVLSVTCGNKFLSSLQRESVDNFDLHCETMQII